MKPHRRSYLPIARVAGSPWRSYAAVVACFVLGLALGSPEVRAQVVNSAGFVLVRFWDGSNIINAGDNANNALRVNVVAGGAGGGNADLRVKDGSAAYQTVGVQTESATILHVPVRVQGTGANVAEPLNSAPAGTEYGLPTRQVGGLPSGTNNIGDVDVLTLPALTAGSNLIGNVKEIPQTACGSTVFSHALQAAPTSATNITTTTTCVKRVFIANTNATPQTILVQDNQGSPITAIPTTSIPGNSSALWDLGGVQLTAGIKVTAGGTGVTIAVLGFQ